MASYAWDQDVAQFLHMDAAGTSDFGAVIAAIGAGVQGQMENFIARTLGVEEYDEYYDGRDRNRLFLRHDPVVSVSSLVINGTAKVVATPATAGCVISGGRESLLLIDGSFFPWGLQNIHVVYKAGIDTASGDGQAFVRAASMWIAQIFKNRDNLGRSSIVRASGQQDNFMKELPDYVKSAIVHLQRAAVPTC
jgi:hypothetical protein